MATSMAALTAPRRGIFFLRSIVLSRSTQTPTANDMTTKPSIQSQTGKTPSGICIWVIIHRFRYAFQALCRLTSSFICTLLDINDFPVSTDEDVQHPAYETDQESTKESRSKGFDGETGYDIGHKLEQCCVDDQCEQSESQNIDRKR